jgi:FlgD Ig-like domain
VPRWGLILLAVALLLGSAAAFTRTERLKLRPGPIGKPDYLRYFSPTCDCSTSKARFSFLLRAPDTLDVYVLDADGKQVATLARGLDRRAGRVELTWDGRDSSGAVAPEGLYRLRIHLHHARRSILLPTTTRLDTTPPHIRLLPLTRTTLSPGLGGDAGTLNVQFRSSERGRATLLVDGKPAAPAKAVRVRLSTLQWDGTVHGRPLAKGPHELTLVVVDRAGNRSQPAGPLTAFVS